MFDLSNPNKYLLKDNTTLKGVASQSFGQIPPWELVKKEGFLNVEFRDIKKAQNILATCVL